MASKLLPASNDGTERFTYTTLLDSVTFKLEFGWNSQRNFWQLLLYDATGALLLSRKIAVGTPMLARFQADDRFPTGDIIALDTSNQDLEPGLRDLDKRVKLIYLSIVDITI